MKLLPSFILMLLAGTASAAPGLRLVVLDPGHGGTNQGAPAHATGGWEKEYTLVIARQVAANLRAEGVEVILTRETDLDMALADRVKFANARQADMLVSLHLNSSERPGPVGHASFFLSIDASDEAARRLALFENQEGQGKTLADTPPVEGDVANILLDVAQNQAHQDASALAAHIETRLGERSPFPNRGVKQAPFVVLMGAAMPAIVVESGFLNHKEEGKFVTSPEGQLRIGRAIADGILDFGRLVLAPRQKKVSDGTP